MVRTLVQIMKQIASLEMEAEQVRAKEVAGVVQRIKTAIDFYGLTTKDLFGSTGNASAKPKKIAVKVKKVEKSPAPPKYKDKETGKTWTGHGKRPGWFVKAIEGGMKAEEMAV
jgi:DNA-binding protein H-NS